MDFREIEFSERTKRRTREVIRGEIWVIQEILERISDLLRSIWWSYQNILGDSKKAEKTEELIREISEISDKIESLEEGEDERG